MPTGKSRTRAVHEERTEADPIAQAILMRLVVAGLVHVGLLVAVVRTVAVIGQTYSTPRTTSGIHTAPPGFG